MSCHRTSLGHADFRNVHALERLVVASCFQLTVGFVDNYLSHEVFPWYFMERLLSLLGRVRHRYRVTPLYPASQNGQWYHGKSRGQWLHKAESRIYLPQRQDISGNRLRRGHCALDVNQCGVTIWEENRWFVEGKYCSSDIVGKS